MSWGWTFYLRRSIPACAGEPSKSKNGHATLKGLSPRVRGNPTLSPYGFFSLGSIPACAGEPWAGTASPELDYGLSPRVRGNHRYGGPGELQKGV